MTVNVENPKESKTSQPTNKPKSHSMNSEFNKVTKYKISTQKSIALLSTDHKVETKVKKHSTIYSCLSSTLLPRPSGPSRPWLSFGIVIKHVTSYLFSKSSMQCMPVSSSSCTLSFPVFHSPSVMGFGYHKRVDFSFEEQYRLLRITASSAITSLINMKVSIQLSGAETVNSV